MNASLVLLALALFGGVPAGDPAPPANAEALFRDGLKAYDAHDYPNALAAFEAAYRLAPRPEILFDIAMTHRSAGNCTQAAQSFDAFIAAASATDPLLPRAQARRRELGPCAPLPAAPAAPTPAPVTPAPPSPPRRDLALKPPAPVGPASSSTPTPTITLAAAPPKPAFARSACAASIGGGLGLAASGAAFGVRAWTAAREAEMMATVWDENAQRADERARTFRQTSAVLLISAGVASLVTLGICSYGSWWGRNNGPRGP